MFIYWLWILFVEFIDSPTIIKIYFKKYIKENYFEKKLSGRRLF